MSSDSIFCRFDIPGRPARYSTDWVILTTT
jgi:hypothetical protein